MATKSHIKNVVSRQLPEFVREDYPTFVAFMEAYYEFLDSNYAQRNLKELRDMDETLDSFVDYFKDEVNAALHFNYRNLANLNEKTILQKIKSYYNGKGSEASLKFLMRLIFNKEAQIYYPGNQLLRVSDGRWQQDISFFVDISSGSVESIVGQQITTTHSSGEQLTLFVERYALVSGNIYEIFVQRYNGQISIGDAVTATGFAATVTGTTTDYEVLGGGGNFSVGQIFDIESGEGSGTKIKITQVSSSGAIQKIQIVRFGAGFESPFVAQLTPRAEPYVDPSPISVSLNSVEQFEVPSNTYTDGFEDIGFISTFGDYWGTDYCDDGTYVGQVITSFSSSIPAGADTTNIASLRFLIGAQVSYPGYYSTNDGFISDSVFIQDSRYYQAFSYVIRIDELLESYVDLVRSFFHPSGMALFAEYQIVNDFNLTSGVISPSDFIRLTVADSVSPTESLIQDFTMATVANSVTMSESLVKSLNKDTTDNAGEIPGETVNQSDVGAVFLNPYSEGNYFAQDYTINDQAASTF